ncbi:MAG: hypothetical protein JXA99_01575 [Candidatus Lokiarchaeota archaeon]|nr:hypothetical protein [Candidatus Lokiarchaeota archaeon]
MSLDKWVNSKQKKKEITKKVDNKKDLFESEDLKKKGNLKKYLLKCPKSNCNYQKTILKSTLSEKDIICSRCKSQMKIKEL